MGLTYLQTMFRQVFRSGEVDYYRYYNVHVDVIDFKSDIDQVVYEGCPENYCQKKTEPRENYDGLLWYCPKCDYAYTYFQYRYKLKVLIYDGSREVEITMFDDTAEDFLGISAPDIAQVHEYDQERYNSYFQEVLDCQTFYFTLRTALVIFRDRPRINCIVKDFEFDRE